MSTEEERWVRHVERKAALGDPNTQWAAPAAAFANPPPSDAAKINRLAKVAWTQDRAIERILAERDTELAAAERRGYDKAVEALRDVAKEARADAEFWDGKAQDGFAAPEELTRRKVQARRQHEAANHADALADYLESRLTQPTEEAP